MFLLLNNRKLDAIIAKILEYLLLADIPDTSDSIITAIFAKVDLGTIIHGLGHFLYFGKSLHQHDD